MKTRNNASPRSKHEFRRGDEADVVLSVAEQDPQLAISLSIYYAELARAQHENDAEAVRYARDAIREAIAGAPSGDIDEPLRIGLRSRRNRAHTSRK